MKQAVTISIVLVLLSMSSCRTSYKLSSDYERVSDFDSYKTYQILEEKTCYQEVKNPITKQRIEDAIHDNLINLGYTKADDPDILISWYVFVEDKKEVEIYQDYYAWWRYHNHLFVYTYKEGTLVIDIIDRKTNRVFWHGTVSDHIESDIENVKEKIEGAVKAIFDQYKKDSLIYDEEQHASNM